VRKGFNDKLKGNREKERRKRLRISGVYTGELLFAFCVPVLCCKSESRWFEISWCQWIFVDIKSFRSHYGPWVDSASNRNEYQKYFLGVKAAGA